MTDQTGTDSTDNDSKSGVTVWDLKSSLELVSDQELRYSRGFLRCRPEKWFPGFGTQWLPMSHAIGTEFVCSSVKSSLNIPDDSFVCFKCKVAEESLGIALDQESLDALVNLVGPGAQPAAKSLVTEYLVRRLLGSFAMSWSGPELKDVSFVGKTSVAALDSAGSVQMTINAGGLTGNLWVLLGERMLDRLDGLWRRQVKSTSSQNADNSMVLDYEIACLALAADSVGQYVKAGTTLDLETDVADQIAIRVSGQDWLPAKLMLNQGRFLVQIQAGPLQTKMIPDSAKRLGVLIGTQELAADDIRELAQVGAMVDTGVPASDMVKLTLDNQYTASGVLRIYDNRFVVTVAA